MNPPFTSDDYQSADDINLTMMRHRYGDKEKLGQEWQDKCKLADKMRTLESGAPNPAHGRYVLEEQVARLNYDMAFLVDQNRIMRVQLDIFMDIAKRFTLVEDAYNYLRGQHYGMKCEYFERLNKLREELKQCRTNSVETPVKEA